jgi:hypothetical protein
LPYQKLRLFAVFGSQPEASYEVATPPSGKDYHGRTCHHDYRCDRVRPCGKPHDEPCDITHPHAPFFLPFTLKI